MGKAAPLSAKPPGLESPSLKARRCDSWLLSLGQHPSLSVVSIVPHVEVADSGIVIAYSLLPFGNLAFARPALKSEVFEYSVEVTMSD